MWLMQTHFILVIIILYREIIFFSVRTQSGKMEITLRSPTQREFSAGYWLHWWWESQEAKHETMSQPRSLQMQCYHPRQWVLRTEVMLSHPSNYLEEAGTMAKLWRAGDRAREEKQCCKDTAQCGCPGFFLAKTPQKSTMTPIGWTQLEANYTRSLENRIFRGLRVCTIGGRERDGPDSDHPNSQSNAMHTFSYRSPHSVVSWEIPSNQQACL